MYGQGDFASSFIYKACNSVYNDGKAFNVDNIHVCEILGISLHRSEVVNGMLFESFIDVFPVQRKRFSLVPCSKDYRNCRRIRNAIDQSNGNAANVDYWQSGIKATVKRYLIVTCLGFTKNSQIQLSQIRQLRTTTLYTCSLRLVASGSVSANSFSMSVINETNYLVSWLLAVMCTFIIERKSVISPYSRHLYG